MNTPVPLQTLVRLLPLPLSYSYPPELLPNFSPITTPISLLSIGALICVGYVLLTLLLPQDLLQKPTDLPLQASPTKPTPHGPPFHQPTHFTNLQYHPKEDVFHVLSPLSCDMCNVQKLNWCRILGVYKAWCNSHAGRKFLDFWGTRLKTTPMSRFQ